VDDAEMHRLVHDRLGVQIEVEMARFLKHAGEARTVTTDLSPVYVIGGDARTGIAVRTIVPPELFTAVEP
jgi:hypothetical protein